MKARHLLLILAVCLPASASAQLPDEALQCFQWFSALGYPDVKEARWAEIWTGSWSGEENTPKAHTIVGFVTKESETEFSAVKTDLTSRTWRKSKPNAPAHERAGFEERPFLPMIELQLASLRYPPKDGIRRFGARLGQKAETFFLAYVCWQRGEHDLAAQLYKEAQKLAASPSDTREPGPMQEDLEIELSHAAMWDAVLRCGGGGLNTSLWGGSPSGHLESRASLLEAFRRILRVFPHSKHAERAKQSAAMLERMVKEDEKHPALTQEQIDQLPQDKRIAELVWMLRDQCGHQMSQPGWCDVFSMDEKGKSPAHQLLAIGYPAAPALIEALTDNRFSRSVGFHRDFYFSHTILTVGDCAQQILSRMSGQKFYSRHSTSGYMSDEEKMLDVQKAARKWWAEYQQKGKKQMLVDSIAAGETLPDTLVRQLQAEAPDAVTEAVLRGADKAQTPWMQRQFIHQLGLLKSPAVTAMLLKFMQKNPDQEVRLEAAARLLNQDHPKALPALLHEWDILPAGDSNARNGAYETLVELLLATGEVQALRKIVDGWDNRPVHERFEVILKMGEWLKPRSHDYYFSAVKLRPVSPEVKAAAIALLVHALEDRQTRDGYGGGMGDFRFNNPPVCDFALWALHEVDGQKFAFTPKADRRQRDAERIAAANVWRQEHQQPLLPPPPSPGVPLAEKDALKIVTVHIEPAKGFEDTPLVKQALALRGTHFGPKTISSLLLSFASEPIRAASGLRIEALREGDLTGVELHLRIDPGTYPTDENKGWNTMHNGQFGSQRLGSSSGSGPLSFARKAAVWESFEGEITTGLKLPPTTGFSLCAGLKASR
ncbi:HEAT repeat domain-containing protein [Prosthecobacter sp.]|uniref:HEAT repeat domain-containing protein n=1 Tax=Prosthecobacter sp. TaxID=1965333 RepID=UPI0037832DA1